MLGVGIFWFELDRSTVEDAFEDSIFARITEPFSQVTAAARKARFHQEDRPKTTQTEDIAILATKLPFTGASRVPDDQFKCNVWKMGVRDRKSAWPRLFGGIDPSELGLQSPIPLLEGLERILANGTNISILLETENVSGIRINPLIIKDILRTDTTFLPVGSSLKMVAILHRSCPKIPLPLSYSKDAAGEKTDTCEYVQGMSDILPPILFSVDGDMVLAFEIFVSMLYRKDMCLVDAFLDKDTRIHSDLEMLGHILRLVNPRIGELAVDANPSILLVCYRWILLWFRREFSLSDTVRLWELLVCNPYCTASRYVVFVAAAIVDYWSEQLLIDIELVCPEDRFELMVQFFNEHAGKHPLRNIASRTETLFLRYEQLSSYFAEEWR